MQHRGPDGHGLEIFGNVGLVHTRLAIVDLTDSAKQPMTTPDGGWSIAFNGEIFNHTALRRELGPRPFASTGDTATLLQALAAWGPDCVRRLNGQFALAAFDVRRERLLLSRDRWGIKPLYLARTDEGLWFASEPSALVAAGVRANWPADGWRAVRRGSCYSGTRTLAEGIVRLRPGTSAFVSTQTGELTLSAWASPVDGISATRQQAMRNKPRRILSQELELVLRRAVHDSMLGDVPIGTLCSGGVDSSLITALASEVEPDLIAFGAHYRGDPALDEGPPAARAAAAIGVELDLLEVTETAWRLDFPRATVHFGAPLANASSVVVAQMAQRARSRGRVVLLTGEGADELFGGYEGLHGRQLAKVLSPAARMLRALEPALIPGYRERRAVIRDRLIALRARRRTEPGWSSLSHDPAFGSIHAAATQAYAHHGDPHRAVEADLLSHMDYTLGHLLNRMDKNMMQHSVEARVPFLDPAVVGFVLNLPLEMRVGPWTKGLLRDVARRLLPIDVAHRPKVYGMDFDAGVWIDAAADRRFLSDGLLRDLVRITRAEFEGLVAATTGADRVRVWSTEVWCRALLAGQPLPAIEAELWPSGP
jgi:asparagine synthase (glutamine-hydrolysing)